MKTGLFFGSFNPVHTGHMIIANFMATRADLREVWMVVSPHNPLKPKSTLANDYDRLHLVRLAIDDNSLLKASDIEFSLPKPSYTIDTLTHLSEKYPGREFVLIMGSDNIATLHKWKNYEMILEKYAIYVYKRPENPQEQYVERANVRYFDAPLLDISATYIRSCIRDKQSVRYLVPEKVYEYLEGSTMYRK